MPPQTPTLVIVFICNGVHFKSDTSTKPTADTTRHVAQTSQEIHDLTAQHGCQYWQVLTPPKQ